MVSLYKEECDADHIAGGGWKEKSCWTTSRRASSEADNPVSGCQEEVKSGSEILDMDTWAYCKCSKKTKP